MLELTSQILGANPDFATLWNCLTRCSSSWRSEVCRGLGPKEDGLALALPGLGPGVEEEWGSQGHRQRGSGGLGAKSQRVK